MFTSCVHSFSCPALPCLAASSPLLCFNSLLIHASLPLLHIGIALDRPIASVGSAHVTVDSRSTTQLQQALLSVVCLSVCLRVCTHTSTRRRALLRRANCSSTQRSTALPPAHIRPHSSPNNSRRHRRNPALDIPCAARRTLSIHNTTPPAASHISAPRPTLMNAHQLLPSMQCHSERPPASANR